MRKRCLLGISWLHHKTWTSNICCPISFSKKVGLWLDLDWIVNPFWKSDLDLDCQSHICDWFGLDCQSKKIGLSNSLLPDVIFKSYQTSLHIFMVPLSAIILVSDQLSTNYLNWSKCFYRQQSSLLTILH